MAKVFNENRYFNTIPNALINDDSLSDRARFLYCYMSAKPEGWEFFKEPIAKALHLGVETVTKYMNELVAKGWIVKGIQQNEKGKFGAVEYTLKNYPVKAKNRDGKNPTVGEKYRDGKNPSQDNSSYNYIPTIKDEEEKERLSNDNQKKVDDGFDLFWESYGYKRDKKTAQMRWSKLKDAERKAAIAAIPDYKRDCQEHNRDMRYPSVYLNKRTWEDEFTGKTDEEDTDEMPAGMTREKWMKIQEWMQRNIPRIYDCINPEMFLSMQGMAHFKPDVMRDIIVEIDQSGYDGDIIKEFERLRTSSKYNERVQS